MKEGQSNFTVTAFGEALSPRFVRQVEEQIVSSVFVELAVDCR